MRARTSALALAAVLLASPVLAQDDPSPSPSTAPEPGASPEADEAQAPAGAWRRTAVGPFGASGLPGGWTGAEVVVVDPKVKRRAAAYIPGLDLWRDAARPPWKVDAGATTHWTGSELLFIETRGAGRRGLAAYDPLADGWRTTSIAPITEIDDSVWNGSVLVARTPLARVVSYDPVTDQWSELEPVPLPEDAPTPVVRLHEGDGTIHALVRSDSLAIVPLDVESGEWGEPVIGPLAADSAEPIWTGEAFLFLTAPEDDAEAAGPGETETDETPEPAQEPVVETMVPRSGTYDPAADGWALTENPCGIDTTDAIWTGALVLAPAQQLAYDPILDECRTLPVSPWPERANALEVWTDDEYLQLSGRTGNGDQPRRNGIAYDPDPGDDALGVALDKPSRPVRVQVPGLGIDLPVISDSRKVAGGTPGYVACDVAERWSAFDMPGTPGTTWINAHAQAGMFLPLLAAMRTDGKEGLLGQRIELQLRDGRVLTYRIFRVNPRATNATIGTKGRKAGEHRLVLQTSTGVGSAPKLLVAARLVDVDTTDEPRPKPKPRACG